MEMSQPQDGARVTSRPPAGVGSSPTGYSSSWFLPSSFTGILLTDDFGQSWEEYVHVAYTEQTIENYLGTRSPTDTLSTSATMGRSTPCWWKPRPRC